MHRSVKARWGRVTHSWSSSSPFPVSMTLAVWLCNAFHSDPHLIWPMGHKEMGHKRDLKSACVSACVLLFCHHREQSVPWQPLVPTERWGTWRTEHSPPDMTSQSQMCERARPKQDYHSAETTWKHCPTDRRANSHVALSDWVLELFVTRHDYRAR